MKTLDTRQEIFSFFEFRPFMVEDAAERRYETDLTDEEKAIIAKGRAHYKAHPEDFVSLQDALL